LSTRSSTTKQTGQPSLNLAKNNFAIFVDGVKKEITNFATPEAPITLTLVVEYSKTSQFLAWPEVTYGARPELK